MTQTPGRADSPILQQQLANYAGVKARLGLIQVRKLTPRPAPILMPIQPLPLSVTMPSIEGGNAPLNMLAAPSWKFLVTLVALRHGLTFDAIIGRAKPKELAQARREAIYLIAQHTAYSTTKIGNVLGGRDHTTILYALSKCPPLERPRLNLFSVAPELHTPADARIAAVGAGYAQARSTAEIAEDLGLTRSTVKGIAFRNNIQHPSCRYRSRKSKLDWEVAGL